MEVIDYFFESSLKKPLRDAYRIEDPISSGPISVISLAENRNTSISHAIKKITKESYQRGNNFEIAEDLTRTISRYRHPNIVGVVDVYEDSKHIYIVMEHCQGGELVSRLKDVENYTEKHVSGIIRDVLKGLAYLHEEGVVHGNIKLENLLSRSKDEFAETMIGDFYMSTIVSHAVIMNAVCGNPSYVAPEVLKGHPLSFKSDLWSVGTLAYVLLSGLEPFPSPKGGDVATYSNILKCNYQFVKPFFNKISDSARHFISTVLRLDPSERASISECLAHPWIGGASIEETPLPGVTQRLHDSLLKKRESLAQKGSLQIARVLARYTTKSPLEALESPFDQEDEMDEEITTDKIDFSDPEALARALHISAADMKQV